MTNPTTTYPPTARGLAQRYVDEATARIRELEARPGIEYSFDNQELWLKQCLLVNEAYRHRSITIRNLNSLKE